MKYYVELSYDMPDISLGRLYSIDERSLIKDNTGEVQLVRGWEDETGYRVEL